MPDVATLRNGGLAVVKDFISRVDSFISSELEHERERRIALALRRDELPALSMAAERGSCHCPAAAARAD